MGFTFNGVDIESVKFNNTAVEKVSFNGVEVWTDAIKVEETGTLTTATNMPFVLKKDNTTGNLIVYKKQLSSSVSDFPIEKIVFSDDGTIISTETINIPSSLSISSARVSLFEYNNNTYGFFTRAVATSNTQGHILNLDDTTELYTFTLPAQGYISGRYVTLNASGKLYDKVFTNFYDYREDSHYRFYQYNPTNHTMDIIRDDISQTNKLSTMLAYIEKNNDLYIISSDYTGSPSAQRFRINFKPETGTESYTDIAIQSLIPTIRGISPTSIKRTGDIIKIMGKASSDNNYYMINIDFVNATATYEKMKILNATLNAHTELIQTLNYASEYILNCANTSPSSILKLSTPV